MSYLKSEIKNTTHHGRDTDENQRAAQVGVLVFLGLAVGIVHNLQDQFLLHVHVGTKKERKTHRRSRSVISEPCRNKQAQEEEVCVCRRTGVGGYLLLAPVRHFPLADVGSPVALPELQEQCGCKDKSMLMFNVYSHKRVLW